VRNDRQVVVLRSAIGVAEPLRPFDVLHLDRDADLGQLRHDHLATLARIGRRRQGHRQFERRLDAGFCQQLLGLLDVVRVDAGGVDVAGQAPSRSGCRSARPAVGCAFDEGLAVDRRQDRAAHAHIVERLALAVHRHDGLGQRCATDHLELRVLLELRHDAGADARESIHIAGQQCGGLRGRVGDEAEHHLVDLGQGLVAVAVPFGDNIDEPLTQASSL
jgi:hypothetical protein